MQKEEYIWKAGKDHKIVVTELLKDNYGKLFVMTVMDDNHRIWPMGIFSSN